MCCKLITGWTACHLFRRPEERFDCGLVLKFLHRFRYGAGECEGKETKGLRA